MSAAPVDAIDITARDERSGPVSVRRAMHDAIKQTADKHNGYVHVSTIRALLPGWATGPQVGAYMTALVRQGVLVHTGKYAPNGNTRTRNRTRPAAIYRLARPLPEVTR